jgi:hypothetical protein
MGRRTVISVIGGAREDADDVLRLAEALGREIRRAGWDLACGGMTGVMEAACRGFQSTEGPGIAIGILPTRDGEGANVHLDLVLSTGMGLARNAIVVQAGHAVVAVGGESGTLSEIALAWQYGRPVVALVPAGGFGAELAGRALDRRRVDEVRSAHSVDEAIALLRRLVP